MKTNAQLANEFPEVDQALIEQIPNLRDPDGPAKRLFDAIALRNRLEVDRKRVLEELPKYHDSVGPVHTLTTSEDAERLLAGEPVDCLDAPITESKRAGLMRQLRAIEMALPAARQAIAPLEMRIIQEQLPEIAPIGREFAQATIDACRNLIACLKAEAQLYDLLNQRGFSTDCMPPYWKLWPQMLGWLHGIPRWPTMEKFCELRAEAWGLSDPEGGV